MTIVYQRIPKSRVGVLVGPEGKVKSEIEQRSGVRLRIDSEGEVEIDDARAFSPVLSLKTRDVVAAIGRGFSPEHAFRLWADDTFFEVLDLTEFVGKKENHLERVKGRLIGTGGRTRRHVESCTGVDLSISGKTVAILGDIEGVGIAREAVLMLIDGATHGHVYSWLDRRRRDIRMHELGLE
ncbi:MAG: KH domain-containing protein [Methanobacteriota archaeon]